MITTHQRGAWWGLYGVTRDSFAPSWVTGRSVMAEALIALRTRLLFRALVRAYSGR